VGLVPANALSEWFNTEVYQEGQIHRATFERGVATSSLTHVGGTTQTGTKLHFKPDGEIFPEVAFDYELIRKRMQELSFLVPGVALCLRDDRNSQEERFYHPDGLAAFARHLNQDADVLFAEPFTHQQEFEGARIAVAFQPTNGFETHVSSFVNSHACTEGTHILGFRAGLKQALAAYGKSHGLFLDRFPTIENYYEGMTAVISVWLEDPMYEGPTRFKLSNVEMARAVAGVVREGIESWAKQRPQDIHQMIEKAIAAAERNVGSSADSQ
jgi:DNA gyrase subunit B